MNKNLLGLATAMSVAALTGCASFSNDGGFTTVAELTQQRTGQTPGWPRDAASTEAARARTAALLAQPLDADSAVAVALLNNRELQARFAGLGIAEADLVRAGRPANPGLRFGRLGGAGSVEIDRAVLFDVLGLLTLPLARQLGQQRFEQAQLQAAHDAVGVAGEARKAFFDAVATQQLVGYFAQVKDAAEASSELARRMRSAGNFSPLAQLREQSFHADAVAQLARARQQALVARERLSRVLALPGGPAVFTLPERLPDLPAAPADAKDAEQAALDRRLDVLMARRATEATARSLGLTRATRFVNVLQAGYQNQSASGEGRRNGYEIELELPLFDFGAARSAQAEATYLQAVNRTAQVALDAQSEVRTSYAAYRSAYELAKHYRNEVVPLRKRISDENLLRYNGMLASVFELLADAREQITSVTQAVEALREHWLAETALQAALAGGPLRAASTTTSPTSATP